MSETQKACSKRLAYMCGVTAQEQEVTRSGVCSGLKGAHTPNLAGGVCTQGIKAGCTQGQERGGSTKA